LNKIRRSYAFQCRVLITVYGSDVFGDFHAYRVPLLILRQGQYKLHHNRDFGSAGYRRRIGHAAVVSVTPSSILASDKNALSLPHVIYYTRAAFWEQATKSGDHYFSFFSSVRRQFGDVWFFRHRIIPSILLYIYIYI